MNPTVKLKTSGPGGAKVVKGLKDLTRSDVLVGVPENRASRAPAPINNAQLVFLHTHGVRSSDMRRIMTAAQKNRKITYSQALALYLHTYGSPRMQIPPRPLVEPAIEDPQNQAIIEGELKLAAKAALDGKDGEVDARLRRAGMIAQNVVKGWFTNPKNNWAPNTPSTIKRKGSDKPLIDTGALRQAITYVVERP